MSSSPSNVVSYFSRGSSLASVQEDLARLRRLLAMAKQAYLSASSEFDSSAIGLGHDDPDLRSHVVLSQIDRLEAAIAALADTAQALHART